MRSCIMPHVVVEERHDVFNAVPQRRDIEVDHIDAVKQVLTELPVGNCALQVAVGRRDDSNVSGRLDALRSHSVDFAVLEKPQKKRLHAERHLADFVHEDGAAVGGLE